MGLRSCRAATFFQPRSSILARSWAGVMYTPGNFSGNSPWDRTFTGPPMLYSFWPRTIFTPGWSVGATSQNFSESGPQPLNTSSHSHFLSASVIS